MTLAVRLQNPRKIGQNTNNVNPFDATHATDVEGTKTNSTLLAHLVKDVSDMGLDNMDLNTTICDLMAT